MPEKSELQEKLVEIIQEHMRMLNPENPGVIITAETKPLIDLPGFDSLIGVAVTVGCLSAMNIADEKLPTIFVEKDADGKNRPLSVSEISDKLCELISK